MNKFMIKNVDEMSVDELIGQLIMIGLPYDYLDEKSKEFIKDFHIGNYILFARNYTDSKQMKKFSKELYELTTDITGSFPLISIDQEGGMVTRLFKDVTFPASPMTTSATSVKDAPRITGEIIGKDMLKMGINLNLAPCMEINHNLASHLVTVRSYGGNKEIIRKNAGLFIQGLHDAGVLACMKHFPGAGKASKDSHLELPIIEESIKDLRNEEMYPFLHNLEADSLMSSHCLFQSFDTYPTTLSHKLLTEFLRDEIHFEGLIISDGMEMKAILDNYGIGNGSVIALKAGCDILLLCHEYDQQLEAFHAVKDAYNQGIITLDELKDKVRRINHYKEKLINGLNKYLDFDHDYEIVKEEHLLMEEIVDKSFTIIMGEAPSIKESTLILTPPARVATIVEDEFGKRDLTTILKDEFPQVKVMEMLNDKSNEEEILDSLENYDQIIIYSYDVAYNHQQMDLINKVLEKHHNTYVVSLKGPIDRQYFSYLKNYSCLYEYTPNSIKTIVKALHNQIKYEGRLPK